MATLADRSIASVISDPPYSEHVHGKQRREEEGEVSSVDLGFGAMSYVEMRALAVEFARLARRWVLIFSDLESVHLWRSALEHGGLRLVRTMIWHRSNAMPQLSGDRPAAGCEAIVCAHAAGRMRWNGGGKDGFFDGPTETGPERWHPTQKPLWLMDELVRLFTDAGEVVLDPYAGSGTTLLAAKRLGRIPLGWEKNPEWHALATRRLDDGKQLGLLERGEAHQLSLDKPRPSGVDATQGG